MSRHFIRMVVLALGCSLALLSSGVEGGVVPVSTIILPVGSAPEQLAVNSATNRIYVSDPTNQSVIVVDGGTGGTLATVSLAPNTPFQLAVDSAANRIYASTVEGPLTLINGALNSVADTEPSFSYGRLATNEATGKVFTAIGGSIRRHDGATLDVDWDIFIPDVYFTDIEIDQSSGDLFLLSPSQSSGIYQVDGDTGTAVGFSPLAPFYSAMAFDNSNGKLWLSGLVPCALPPTGGSRSENRHQPVPETHGRTWSASRFVVQAEMPPVSPVIGFASSNALYLTVDDANNHLFTAGGCPSWPAHVVGVYDSPSGTPLGGADLPGVPSGIVSNAVAGRTYISVESAGQLVVVDELQDSDVDTVADVRDNCPDAPNSSQLDTDGDWDGDVCDNCPLDWNADQNDIDGDSVGDACDPDADGDSVVNEIDNCSWDPNADQLDTDSDGAGNVCDFDDDGDAVRCGLIIGKGTTCGLWDAGETACGSDPLDTSSFPERTDLSGDEDKDGQFNEALPAGAEDFDCDIDGFAGNTETFVGTQDQAVCSADTLQNNEPQDVWPTDNNDDQRTNLSDIIRYGPHYNKISPDPNYDQRFDLNTDGRVNLSDIVLFGPYYNNHCSIPVDIPPGPGK